MTDTTETPIEPRSRETVTRDLICAAAENEDLTKRQRNEEIAGQLTAFLTREGHFEMNDGEITYADHAGEVSYPLITFFERQDGDLLDQLGVYVHGTYNAYVAAVIGKLALDTIAAMEDPEMDKYF
jgi:hypothetical protein